MRVPTYSPMDFAGALMDALDWRRMMIGLVLAAWSAFMLAPLGEVLAPLIEHLPSNLDLATIQSIDFFTFGWRLALWGPIATYLILFLARGGTSEFCAGKRASFPEMKAFANANILPALFTVSFAPVLYAPVAAVVCLGLWLLPSGWGIAILVIVGIPALIAQALFTLWAMTLPILFSALAVSGGDGYEAISRSAFYVARRPIRYSLIILGKLIALGMVVAPVVVVSLYAPTWAQWLLLPPMLGFAASYGALTDVIIFVKLRHAVDGTPYTLYHRPSEAFLLRASSMEQAVAQERSGIVLEQPNHA